jgi:hypothetical protein
VRVFFLVLIIRIYIAHDNQHVAFLF